MLIFRRLIFFAVMGFLGIPLMGFWGFGSDKLQARTEKRHFKIQNQRKTKSKGPKRFMLTQKALKAQIEMHPDDPESLLITLQDLDPYITYYKVEPNRNFGILSIKQYMWYCHFGRSMFSKDNPRGALAYLSFEAGGEDHTLSFNVFQLNQPKYDKRANQLTYQVDSLPGFDVEKLVFGDVILTIDLSLN